MSKALAKKALEDNFPGLGDFNRMNLLEGLELGGPNYFGIQLFQTLGHAGLSLFGLAGLVGRSPKQVLADLKASKIPVTMGLCTGTMLPILNLGWGGQRGFEDFHEEDLEGELYEQGKKLEDHPAYLPNMLKKYGGKNWRRHCTRTFAPFSTGSERHMTLEQWIGAKRVIRAWRKKVLK